MNQKKIITAMCNNMSLQMTYFAQNLFDHEVVNDRGITLVYSPIKSNTFNCVVRTNLVPQDSVEQRINEVKAFFQQRAVPFAWWVGPLDAPKDLDVRLIQQGFVQDEQEVGMFLELGEYQPVPLSICLENKCARGEPVEPFGHSNPSTSSGRARLETNTHCIKRVLDKQTLRLFDDVHAICGFSLDAYEKRFAHIDPMLYQEGASMELYVGMIENKPIVTGMLVFSDGVAGIYYIATVPAERRKGYGTAMMHALLTRAKKQGYEFVTLQASEMGKTVYQKMGFEAICEFKVFCM